MGGNNMGLGWIRVRQMARGCYKRFCNKLFEMFGRSAPYELNLIDRMSTDLTLGFPNKRINSALKKYFLLTKDNLLGHSISIVIILMVIAILWGTLAGFPTNDNLLVEFWGLIFDVLVILVGFGYIQHQFQNGRQRVDNIARQHETIEDYKRWNSEEAVFRVAGAIRRLNKLGVSKVELADANLENFDLNKLGIKSIEGSYLDKSIYLSGGRSSKFVNCSFGGVNCRNVVFSNSFLKMTGSTYIDCNFYYPFHLDVGGIEGADFSGAILEWSEPPEKELYEDYGEDEYGQPVFNQIVYGRFIDADLTDVKFCYAEFKNADFRKATAIDKADFTGAKGLETCVFDSDELKARIVKKSKEKTNE